MVDIDGIVKFMKLQSAEAMTHLNTMKAYHAFPSTEKVTVIGYLDDNRRKRDQFFRIGFYIINLEYFQLTMHYVIIYTT